LGETRFLTFRRENFDMKLAALNWLEIFKLGQMDNQISRFTLYQWLVLDEEFSEPIALSYKNGFMFRFSFVMVAMMIMTIGGMLAVVIMVVVIATGVGVITANLQKV